MQNSSKRWSSTLFAAYFSPFQVAHSVEREILMWKVVGSIPSEVIVLSYSKVQPIVANIAAHNCWIYNLCDCKICNWKLKILQLMATATNSCKYCNQIATGQITQLIVANFATRIFAVHSRISFWLNHTLTDIYFVIEHTVLDDNKHFSWFDSPRYKKLSMAPISHLCFKKEVWKDMKSQLSYYHHFTQSSIFSETSLQYEAVEKCDWMFLTYMSIKNFKMWKNAFTLFTRKWFGM